MKFKINELPKYGVMNQDVYRIGKCFSHRDCVIKITCKTSPLVSICLSDDLFFVFLSGIFKRWRLRQDWSAQWLMPTSIVWQVHFRTQWVYDFLVFFTFWFGCWSSDRLCSQGIWLAQPKSRVEHNAQNRQQAPFHFCFVVVVSVSLTLNQSPGRFVNMHSRTAERFIRFPFGLI